MLNRTEPKPKARVLSECNLLASIRLPQNTFFNTAQKTYILVLEKRHSPVDPRPEVFSAIARSIGETLDWQRVPTPHENDLADIAERFVAWTVGDRGPADASPLVKLVPPEEFEADDRWDVTRFWTDDEMVALGEKESPVERVPFIVEARDSLSQIATDLEAAQQELEALGTATTTRTVSLGDSPLFGVDSGTRIRGADIRENPGDVPVYSCFKDARIEKGRVSEDWLKAKGIPIQEGPCVTVNANGASVGKVFVREERCVMTDDVIVVNVLSPEIDLHYLAIQLRSAVAKGGYLYEAKLFQERVKDLEIDLPVSDDGTFDTEQQRVIASAVKRFDSIRERLAELGTWSQQARIA